MPAAVLHYDVYAPSLVPISRLEPDSVDRTLALLPTSTALTATLVGGTLAPSLVPISRLEPDSVDRTLALLPTSTALTATLVGGTLATQTPTPIVRISAFVVTSHDPVVLTTSAAAAPTQTWYQG